ncbi:hypothetical protein ACRAWG_10425 [Methylobacterium sp. P31]
MTPLQHLLLSVAEHDRVLAEANRRAMTSEFDARVVRNARQAIQRSRELLEATKHQVRASCQQSDRGS